MRRYLLETFGTGVLAGCLLWALPARAGTGTLLYDVPQRWPGSTRVSLPAAGASVVVDGLSIVVSASGEVTWSGTSSAVVTTSTSGPNVVIDDASGLSATTLSLPPSGSVTWSVASDENGDAELSAFIHVEKARAYCLAIAPSLSALEQPIAVEVNATGGCQASSTATSLTFHEATAECENTARIADLVYHELGRLFHRQAVTEGSGAVDDALGEGAGDYLAATITGDPAIAPGLDFTAQPLRHIDPDDEERVWPDDIVAGDDAATGLIIAGALWDLRKLLGVATTDTLFYGGLKNAVDIPSMYEAVLAADDDDDDPSDGTPNECAVNQAFAAHGLFVRARAGDNAPLEASPNPDGFDVTLELQDTATRCETDAVTGATLDWHLADAPDTDGQIDMTYAADTETLSGHLPSQPAGSVIRYRIELTFGDEATTSFPEGSDDYELLILDEEPTPGPDDIDAGTTKPTMDGGDISSSSDAGPDAEVAMGGEGGSDASASGPGDAGAEGDASTRKPHADDSGCSAHGRPEGGRGALLAAVTGLVIARRRARWA